MKIKLIIVSLLSVLIAAGSLWVTRPDVMTVQQRGVICNYQEYEPANAHEQIQLCRDGYSKKVWQ
ncbi:hypothetical protein [Klebsiella aerogenes]|uniref:hypothetical protein n=1 Tax=Klebsiella aerogenes TaxID=548 RepID=UPI000735B78F|nr:hypothetical protein [Klebsiella aerogenes]KTH33863.1 hypothetical protein ASV26_08560 [Klebsiella aerogenes]MDT4308402.1 hypothetical protein [Klebsiella aerogenes]